LIGPFSISEKSGGAGTDETSLS